MEEEIRKETEGSPGMSAHEYLGGGGGIPSGDWSLVIGHQCRSSVDENKEVGDPELNKLLSDSNAPLMMYLQT